MTVKQLHQKSGLRFIRSTSPSTLNMWLSPFSHTPTCSCWNAANDFPNHLLNSSKNQPNCKCFWPAYTDSRLSTFFAIQKTIALHCYNPHLGNLGIYNAPYSQVSLFHLSLYLNLSFVSPIW